MKEARDIWLKSRIIYLNKAMAKLVFINETSTNTKLAKQTGWAPIGEKLIDHVPYGHWQIQPLSQAFAVTV